MSNKISVYDKSRDLWVHFESYASVDEFYKLKDGTTSQRVRNERWINDNCILMTEERYREYIKDENILRFL